MTCIECEEFLSALCDGETVPREVAEHIGSCANCQLVLNEYLEIGVELRRMASLDPLVTPPMPAMNEPSKNLFRTWWRLSWQAMRVPRLAVVSLLLVIAMLASGLVTTRVRARDQRNVVLLKVTQAPGQSVLCALSSVDEKWNLCSAISVVDSGIIGYQMKLIAIDGDHVILGVKGMLVPKRTGDNSVDLREVMAQPEKQYSFEPGETSQVDIPGFGPMTVTGEWIDHVPAIVTENPSLDPDANQLRVYSPVILRDKQVLGDIRGNMISVDKTKSGVYIYFPSEGRLVLSTSPLPGSIRGRLQLNRAIFEIQGHRYEVIAGAPIARGDKIWVLHEPNFEFPDFASSAFPQMAEVDLSAVAEGQDTTKR
jgi:hypothetical protein